MVGCDATGDRTGLDGGLTAADGPFVSCPTASGVRYSTMHACFHSSSSRLSDRVERQTQESLATEVPA
jgi:hypothetical protein